MDLDDAGPDTDLVVAKGNQSKERTAFGNVNARPVSPSRLGQTVPLHLFHPTMYNYSGRRMYSSSSSTSSPGEDKSSESEDRLPDAISTASKATDVPQHEFASLRGLFGAPRKPWSPPPATPFASNKTSDSLPSEPEQQSAAVDGYFDNNPFEDELPDLSPPKEVKSKARDTPSVGEEFNPESKGRTGTDVASDATPDTPGLRPQRFRIHRPAPPLIRYEDSTHKPGSRNFESESPRRKALRQDQQASIQAKPLPAWKVDSTIPEPPPRQDRQHTETSSPQNSVKLRKPVQAVTSDTGSPSPFLDETSSIDAKQINTLEAELFPESAAQESATSTAPKAQTSAPSAPTLTHLTSTGEAHMVDVGQKEATDRVAVAVGFVRFGNSEPYRLITENLNKKGDVLGIARIAGIMAAKKTSDIIPLCHPIPITKISILVGTHKPGVLTAFNLKQPHGMVSVEARVHTYGKTGVEMEAITAVTAACMTVYDMCKAVDKEMTLDNIRLLYKDGGKSGMFLDNGYHAPRDRYIWTNEDPDPSKIQRFRRRRREGGEGGDGGGGDGGDGGQ